MCHSAYKREKYAVINTNIKVINTILKVNRDNRQTLKCKHYSLTFLSHYLQFNSIPGRPLSTDKTNMNALVQSIVQSSVVPIDLQDGGVNESIFFSFVCRMTHMNPRKVLLNVD